MDLCVLLMTGQI